MLLRVSGVISVARFKTQELTLLIGGERKTVVVKTKLPTTPSMKSKVPRFW